MPLPQPDEMVPYAPDFTPSTLGKTLGEGAVLGWVLGQVATLGNKAALQGAIASTCLAHIADPTNRRDMASHVVQGLGNYGLMIAASDGSVALTPAGAAVVNAPDAERDRVFARHVLTRCNGMRLIEHIREYELRGESPGLEDLARALDRNPTAKNVSTMKAWLVRAGVLLPGTGYRVASGAIRDILGNRVADLLRLSEVELEFLVTARQVQAATGETVIDAKVVADAADSAARVVIPRKSLSNLVAALETKGFLRKANRLAAGGTRNTVELTLGDVDAADEEIRALASQADAAYLIDDLRSVVQLLTVMDTGNGFERGIAGEELAVHVCLLLGLRVVAWRQRSPATEIDLTAERTVGLAYQRWNVQVKNTFGDLDVDRVDREIGAAVGTGVTHILFVVPRAGMTDTARRELLHRSKLSHLHVYVLLSDCFSGTSLDYARLVGSLQEQEDRIARAKRAEATRRDA